MDKMIKFEKNIFHEKHNFAHEFCIFVHDLIVQTLQEGESSGIFNINVDETPNNDIKSHQELFNWFVNNGKLDEARILFFKAVIAAMISDFGHFTYEALNCSKKGKLTVTFALLRKAFKDHLIYFEWLLADPDDFINIFLSGDICKLSLDKDDEKKKKIIKIAMNKLRPYWGTPDFIHEIRYTKNQISLGKMWDQANHLVTTFNKIKTDPLNFNFIFSGVEEMKRQWDHLYALLPILFTHTYHVIEELIKKFSRRVNEERDITDLKVMSGYFLWHQNYDANEKMPEMIKELFTTMGFDKLKCKKCNFSFDFSSINIVNIYNSGTVVCLKCKNKFKIIGKYIGTQLVKKSAHLF